MRPPRRLQFLPSGSVQIKSTLRARAAQAAEDPEEGREGFLEEVAPRLSHSSLKLGRLSLRTPNPLPVLPGTSLSSVRPVSSLQVRLPKTCSERSALTAFLGS